MRAATVDPPRSRTSGISRRTMKSISVGIASRTFAKIPSLGR